MNITIWTLAWDTDNGTGCSLHKTEREAYQALLDQNEQLTADERAEGMKVYDSPDGDFWEWFDANARSPLDTYSVDSQPFETDSQPEPVLIPHDPQDDEPQDDQPETKEREIPPDPEGMNDERAAWAAVALRAFSMATRTDPGDVLADLLADLKHWADRNGQDFDDELARAEMNYEAETESENMNECQNCGKTWPDSELNDIKDLSERVAPGEPMPTGECPACGALCQPVEDKQPD